MWLLALDTATSRTAVALVHENRCVAELDEPSRSHSGSLLPLVDRMLKEERLSLSSLGAIAVGVGPGSFTGVRVGLVTAKTLAFALRVPLVGVSTLRALAENGLDQGVERIAVVQDALKQEVFRAVYLCRAGRLETEEGEAAEAPAQLASRLASSKEPTLVLGSGVVRYQEVFQQVMGESLILPGTPEQHFLRASAVGKVGLKRLEQGQQDDPRTLEPVYCRLSEAELGRLKQGLPLLI